MISPLVITLILAIVLALVLAPVEALRWWATQGIKEAGTTAATLTGIRRRLEIRRQAQPLADRYRSYIVYLAGVGAVADQANPIGEQPLLDELQAAMPDVLLISDVYPYSPANRTLLAGRWSSGWWRFVEWLGRKRPTRIAQLLVYGRNALQFAVSADDRYGPVYSLGVARVIWDRLVAAGYRPESGTPIVLLGWSGGAQIALSAAWYLSGAGMPVYLLSLGGVLTSDPGLDRIRHLWHLKGTKDWMQAIGNLFPGRWPGRRASYWARAITDARATIHTIGPMSHLGRGSYLSSSRLADGRTCRQVVGEEIQAILRAEGLAAPAEPNPGAGPAG
ncbi:MAG: hypothetical protein Q4F67_10575 [Propionibacteriaceae bacterium]|nr:hypothetical protein [Propionibacteriaceae bacterium]